MLKMMQQYHLPVTAFLIEEAAQKHLDYWRAFLSAGGDIEDHTFSHPKLTALSPAAMAEQIDRPVDYYRALGTRPVLLRPPYGDYNRTVCQAAYAGGIEDVVMWNAVMANGSLQTYNGRPLQPGDIILLHWDPGLNEQLTKLLTILKRQQLGVADLRTALTDPGNLKVASLDKFRP
ncbi:hypothetical protein A6M21_12475 [Desulfotomaculum copahuensis]|uniref:NodB homology domain-containing protein n=1 Tax=Desulfotomaculum copahuensis TaxID=1838280 RepID=A0A1B7LCY6_9FIRM|nr:hypothetical protein A6M21_12475 [Desulfotomaculum copahuensis]